MNLSAGVAYVTVLPEMSKFAPALAGQTTAATSVLGRFAKFGTLAVAAVGAGSVKMAAEFEQSMRNVNSIAQLPEPAFQSLNEEVLKLAGPTAQAPKTLADGLYDLVSSGFDAKESLVILESSAKAATAGMTTTDVAVKGVAAVLNAYRLPASKAAEVSDQLFRTVDRGVITFAELSTGIGDTLPFASSLGVGLEEVGAATATMTKQGLSGAETFTRIRNLMQTMIKPGTDLANAIEELGYENGESLIKAEGFQGALEKLVGTTDGTKDEVAKLFPNIRALGGALALTGKNTEAARKDLDGMRDSAGATSKAFEEQSKSLAVQWQELKARISVLAIEIGNKLIPALTDAVEWINEGGLGRAFEDVKPILEDFGGLIKDVVNFVGDLPAPMKQAIGVITAMGIAASVATSLLGKLRIAALLSNPWTAIPAAIYLATKALENQNMENAIAAGEAAEGAIELLEALTALKEGAKQASDAIGFSTDGIVAGFNNVYGAGEKMEAGVGVAIEGVGRAVTNGFSELFPEFKRVGQRMAHAVRDGIKAAGRGAIDAAKTLAGDAANAADGEAPKWGKAGRLLAHTLGSALEGTGPEIANIGRGIAGEGAKGSNTQRGAFQGSGRGHGQAVGQGIGSASGTVASAARGLAATGASAVRSAVGSFQSAGAAMGNALAAGLRSAISGVAAAANALAAAAARANSNRRAAGGPVTRGQSYIVGERGQELFVPSTNGYIIPNHALPRLATGIEGAARGGRQAFVITNWRTGEGYMRSIADGAVVDRADYERTRSRMGS